MGKPAARVGDMHVCPMVTPGTPPIPHVGGPLLPPGVPTVLIGGMPAAVMGGMGVCTGPPDSVILGSTGVMIGGQPAARMGDMCAHGGTIAAGLPTVLIGETMPGAPPVVVVPPFVLAPVTAQPPSAQASVAGAAAVRGTPFTQVCGRTAQTRQAAAPSTAQTTDWIEVLLVDEDKKPVAGEKYLITLSDGSEKQGLSDGNGRIRIDGVIPGACKITFPELDANDWQVV